MKGRKLHRPTWWLVLAWTCALVAIGCGVGAIWFQRVESRPIGEGEVFVADAAVAAQLVSAVSDLDLGVRQARNTLGIEAVSVVADDGGVVASTSDSFVGTRVTNDLLADGVATHGFAALAAALDRDLFLDGVVRWPSGTVLYQVVSPLGSMDSSLLLQYDIGKLLARRVQPGRIQPGAVQLLALAAVFGALGGVVFVGHFRGVRRNREVALEAELLRKHSEELQEANRHLDVARLQAEEALALAEEKIRIRSEFVLMINHELRTPLTSVVTGAELLRAADLGDDDRDAVLESIVRDGARLQEMIDQILAVARIENRGLFYELTGIPVQEVLTMVGGAHAAATLDLPAGLSLDLMVRTDPAALGMVVASLVDNAFTHGATQVTIGCAEQGRFRPQVEVGTAPKEALFITIADNGPGIDPEFLPRVFEKFEKSSFSSGTGLGLYMARMLIEALEGSIAVKSSSLGTVFQVAVPAARVPAGVVS